MLSSKHYAQTVRTILKPAVITIISCFPTLSFLLPVQYYAIPIHILQVKWPGQDFSFQAMGRGQTRFNLKYFNQNLLQNSLSNNPKSKTWDFCFKSYINETKVLFQKMFKVLTEKKLK